MPLQRLVIVICLAGLVACGEASAAVPPRAELRGLSCRHTSGQTGRAVSVTAVMRPVARTTRMALKFELDRRTPGSWFRPVAGRQFGQWISPSNATLGQNPADVWMLRQNVVNLAAPAAYRFRVWFRWTGAGGRVLGVAMRLSSVCHQSATRADVVVRSVTVKPLANGDEKYDAVIHNAGAAASGVFAVELDPPGSGSLSTVGQSLAPGATEHAVFDAPVCAPGSVVTVVADPGRQVADSNRANNTLTMGCPDASGGSYTS
jgi:hypothetical protein